MGEKRRGDEVAGVGERRRHVWELGEAALIFWRSRFSPLDGGEEEWRRRQVWRRKDVRAEAGTVEEE